MSDVTTPEEWTKPLPQPDDVNRAYWSAGVEGRLVIQQCPRCSHRQFYPRALCTKCGDEPEWMDCSGRGTVHTFTITPEDVGFQRVKPEALRGGDANDNARALLDVLKGQTGPYRDVAILNAAAGLIVAARAKDLKQAVALATKAVDSGEAEGRLDRLIAISNG